jgi:WD repeat-containing protein 19
MSIQVGDYRGAIEFLLLARRRDDAFEIAAAHNEMGLYVQVGASYHDRWMSAYDFNLQALRMSLAAAAAGTDLSAMLNAAANAGAGDAAAAAAAAAAIAEVQLPTEEANKVAAYFENAGDPASAAALFAESGQFARALRLYLAVKGDGEPAALEAAIAVVARAQSEALQQALVDHLTGEGTGAAGGPKDPHYIFKLYMALGNYAQAAATALIIARQEQELGNYKVAHSMLYGTYRDLIGHGVGVPLALVRTLALLHSYLLVKKLVRLENHDGAARMMVRVAASISRFPAHVVPILTSTVIECQRAGMKRSAYTYAVQMMKPEYRDQIEEKFKKKIEALVRRPATEEAEQPFSPCPFCGHDIPAYSLDCTDSCRNYIPFCIVSGRHMTLEECSYCPSCRFPALLGPLNAYLAVETACPMCGDTIVPGTPTVVPDALGFLRKAVSVIGATPASAAEAVEAEPAPTGTALASTDAAEGSHT